MNQPVEAQHDAAREATDPACDGFFEAIDADECRALLDEVPIGRLGCSLDGQPMILPITFVRVGDLIVFRTAEQSSLARCANQVVAFEVDQLDPETGVGWSVLARGPVLPVSPELGAGLRPWAGGSRPLVLGVRLDQVGGRVVSRPETA